VHPRRNCRSRWSRNRCKSIIWTGPIPNSGVYAGGGGGGGSYRNFRWNSWNRWWRSRRSMVLQEQQEQLIQVVVVEVELLEDLLLQAGANGGSGIVIVKELNKASGSWPLSAQFRSQKSGTWPRD
jgi:hypothetical protein